MYNTFGKRAPVIFILPGFLGFTLFYIWPFLYSLKYAVTDKPIGGVFIGLGNFVELFANTAYLTAVKNTAFFIGVSVPLGMVLSLTAAILINRLNKNREAFTLLFLMPLIIPSGSTLFFWKSFFADKGFLNSLIAQFGGDTVSWLATPAARAVIITIFLWKSIGYSIILFLAGIASIPREYYEAAAVDGAGAFCVFRRISFPGLLPTFIMVFIMSLINSFKVFREIYVLTGSYPHDSIYMLQHFMNNMFNTLSYQKLTTATCVLVIAVTAVTQALFTAERKAGIDG